jgi:putative endonuclease
LTYVYILECNDGSLYTGWTNNLNKRIETHNQGKGAKYTSCRLPVVLKYSETFQNKVEAQKREYQIKQYSRLEKLNLIHGAT